MNSMSHCKTMKQRKLVNVVTPTSGRVGDNDPRLKAGNRTMDHSTRNYAAGRRSGGPFGK